MTSRTVHVDCKECESDFIIDYDEEVVSKDVPEVCPFCGEPIESVEDLNEDDDEDMPGVPGEDWE